jgi:hypothetical protein
MRAGIVDVYRGLLDFQIRKFADLTWSRHHLSL